MPPLRGSKVVFGIPNGFDVLSNVPFAVIGVLGLVVVARRGGMPHTFADRWDRWPYAALFLGTLLTAFGSTWYHLAPDNGRLVWDRLPMTLGFMGLLAAVGSERVSVHVAKTLFIPLVLLGGSSVAYWYWTELQRAGDLRVYALTQFGSLLAVVAMLARYPNRASGTGYIWMGLLAYAASRASRWPTDRSTRWDTLSAAMRSNIWLPRWPSAASWRCSAAGPGPLVTFPDRLFRNLVRGTRHGHQ